MYDVLFSAHCVTRGYSCPRQLTIILFCLIIKEFAQELSSYPVHYPVVFVFIVLSTTQMLEGSFNNINFSTQKGR